MAHEELRIILAGQGRCIDEDGDAGAEQRERQGQGPGHGGPADVKPGYPSAAARPANRPRPSVLPWSGRMAFSGWGIMPRTLPDPL